MFLVEIEISINNYIARCLSRQTLYLYSCPEDLQTIRNLVQLLTSNRKTIIHQVSSIEAFKFIICTYHK